MPLGGENVGTAYVRILADGSQVPDGIRDALGENDEIMRTQGKNDSAAYDEAFEENYKKNTKYRKEMIAKALNLGSGKFDAIAETMASGLDKSLRNKLRTQFAGRDDSLADIIANNILGDFTRTGNYEGMLQALSEGLPQQVDRALKEIQRLEDNYAKEHAAAVSENNRRDIETRRKMLDEAYALNVQFNKRSAFAEKQAHDERMAMLNEAYSMNRNVTLKTQVILRDAYRENAEFDRKRRVGLAALRVEYAKYLDIVERTEKGEKGLASSRRETFKDIRALRTAMSNLPGGNDDRLSFEIERINDRLIAAHPRLISFNKSLDRTSSILGRATGKGSRNNFLNLIGSMVGGFTSLITLAPRLVANLGTKVADAFTKAGGGIAGLVSGLGQLVIGIGLGIAAIGALGAAALALVFIVGPIAALISGLVGIVVALAGSIAFALTGALVAVIGPLGAVAAGLGVLVLGLTNMSDELKDRVKKQLQPVIDGFKELGEVGARAITSQIGEQARLLAPVLERLKPLVKGIGEALADVGTSIADDLDSPGFNKFLQRIDKFLPDAVRSLGDIFSQTLGGIGGIFTGAIPLMEEFLGWLDRITMEFSEWANSPRGQKEIKEFFADASASAKALGGFIEDAWNFLVLLLDEGRGTGDSIFERMGKNIEKFTKYLEDNPDALSDWFANAENIAIELGDLVVGLGEIFDELDNETNRKSIQDFLDTLGKIASTADTAIGALSSLFSVLTLGLSDDIGKGLDVFGDLGFADTSTLLLQKFTALPQTILGWVGKISLTSAIKVSIPTIVGFFTGLGPKILKAMGSVATIKAFDFPSPVKITGYFVGLGAKILTSIGKVFLLKSFDFPSFGKITGFFGGLGAAILKAAGKVFLLKAFDIPSLSDIASKFSGLAGAILDAIGTVVIRPIIDMPSIPFLGGGGDGGSKSGTGVVERGVVERSVTEDPAVIPFTIGVGGKTAGTSGKSVSGKTVDASGWTIVSPNADPKAVAAEVLNELTARAY